MKKCCWFIWIIRINKKYKETSSGLNIDFEKFLCSLLLLAENIEGVLYDVINARMAEKQKQYDKLPLQSLEQIYAAIDVNIQDTYKYNKDTIFCVIDVENETNHLFEIPEDEIDNINQLNNLSKGCYVWDLYINK